MLTMFQVLTLEGWLDVRDMFMNDPASPGIPSTKEAWVNGLQTPLLSYMHTHTCLVFHAVHGYISTYIHLPGCQHWPAVVCGYCSQ